MFKRYAMFLTSIKLLFSAVCLSTISCLVSAESLSTVDIKKAYRNTVVSITNHYESEDGNLGCNYGSGVLITKLGHVISSKHILTDSSGQPTKKNKLKVSVGEPLDCEDPVGIIYKLNYISIVSGVDAALFQIQRSEEFPFAVMCKDTDAVDGENIFMLGYPFTEPLDAREGQIGSRNGPGGLYSLALDINKGNSGGPIFNSNGWFIGIVKGNIEEANGYGFMVPVQLFKVLIEAYGKFIDCSETLGSDQSLIGTLNFEFDLVGRPSSYIVCITEKNSPPECERNLKKIKIRRGVETDFSVEAKGYKSVFERLIVNGADEKYFLKLRKKTIFENPWTWAGIGTAVIGLGVYTKYVDDKKDDGRNGNVQAIPLITIPLP